MRSEHRAHIHCNNYKKGQPIRCLPDASFQRVKNGSPIPILKIKKKPTQTLTLLLKKDFMVQFAKFIKYEMHLTACISGQKVPHQETSSGPHKACLISHFPPGQICGHLSSQTTLITDNNCYIFDVFDSTGIPKGNGHHSWTRRQTACT